MIRLRFDVYSEPCPHCNPAGNNQATGCPECNDATMTAGWNFAACCVCGQDELGPDDAVIINGRLYCRATHNEEAAEEFAAMLDSNPKEKPCT
jgi:hypothetical protein